MIQKQVSLVLGDRDGEIVVVFALVVALAQGRSVASVVYWFLVSLESSDCDWGFNVLGVSAVILFFPMMIWSMSMMIIELF